MGVDLRVGLARCKFAHVHPSSEALGLIFSYVEGAGYESPAPGCVGRDFFPPYQAGSWAATFASAGTVKCLARRFAMATTVTVGGRPQGSGMIVVSMQ